MNEKKIETLSRILKVLFLGLACALPIVNAGGWITDGYMFLQPWIHWEVLPQLSEASIPAFGQLSVQAKLLGFLISLIPVGFKTAALLFLMKLFGLFEKREFFSKESVLYIRKLGFCLLFGQLVYPFYMGMMTLALTMNNPPGMRNITVGFEGEQASLTIVALIVILVSWIMNEGRKLQEESEATI